jgi:two-component system, LuxR family, sensor kinase FixL
MPQLDSFFGYAESHRATICVIAGVMVAVIAWADAYLPIEMSFGFLYLIPIVLAAACLSSLQIVLVSSFCSFLRELYDPGRGPAVSTSRLIAAGAGFAMAGFFVTGLSQRRRLLQKHVNELEAEVRLRQDAESQVRVLIETSPLAILTLNQAGRIVLANESARELLEFGERPLQGVEVAPYLPILQRMLNRQERGNMRTNVECTAHRSSGEMLLANVWVSTYETSAGPGLAAVIWDASENLRDRETTKLDSMLATSRVLIGAISHEIRNLAAAASACYAKLPPPRGTDRAAEHEALGSLIGALERVATSGLRLASQRETAVADLGTILDEARIVIEPLLRDAGFIVTWNIEDGLPLVQCDQQSLLQVFVNLARNVIEHGADGPEQNANISAGTENNQVVVRFRDSGPGVARPEELFQQFQAGAQSYGLGLYISRAILRSYGGDLRYEPVKMGACFLVELWPVEKRVG